MSAVVGPPRAETDRMDLGSASAASRAWRNAVALAQRMSRAKPSAIMMVAATDERAFYAMKSLHYEKLKGDREGQHSMRLNDQWRLILTLAVNDQGKRVVILSITDYH